MVIHEVTVLQTSSRLLGSKHASLRQRSSSSPPPRRELARLQAQPVTDREIAQNPRRRKSGGEKKKKRKVSAPVRFGFSGGKDSAYLT